jgi:ribosome-associated protein
MVGMEIELAPGVWTTEDGLRLQYARSGGPGGQNVNKLNTKAELWVRLAAMRGMSHGAVARLRALAGRRVTIQDEIHLSSETERGQEGNRAAVMQRLREMIVQAKVEPKVRRKKKVSRAAKARRVDAKKRRGAIKSMRRDGGSHD